MVRPLFINYYLYSIKYWCRLILVLKNSRYPRNCYLMLKSLDDVGRRTWATYGNIWFWKQEVGNVNQCIRCFKERLLDYFEQNWHGRINESGRCLHYKHYKSLWNSEKDLLIDISFNHKITLPK